MRVTSTITFILIFFSSCEKNWFEIKPRNNENDILVGTTTTSKDPRLAILNTISVDSITNTSINVNSEIIYDGGSKVTQRGVCWGINPNPTITDNSTKNGSGSGSFISSITSLTPNTTYYVRVYATNSLGTAYGNQIKFTTSNITTLTTVGASNVTKNSAVSGGNITYDGGLTITQRGVCWGINPNPTITDNNTSNGSGSGSFTSSITSLTPNTTYYIRAYATNALGTAYGNQIKFTTTKPTTKLVGSNNCASLNGITSLYDGWNGTTAAWGLSNTGHSGPCWIAPDPNDFRTSSVAGSSYVQFNRNFSNQGYIEFWVNTYKPGSNNVIPVISVNGSALGNATMVDGRASSFYWMKVRSPIIQSGNNNIRISFGTNYAVIKVDEIEFYEY